MRVHHSDRYKELSEEQQLIIKKLHGDTHYCLNDPECDDSDEKGKVGLIVGLVIGFILCALGAMAFYCFIRSKQESDSETN